MTIRRWYRRRNMVTEPPKQPEQNQQQSPSAQQGTTGGDNSPLIQGTAHEGSTLKQAGRDYIEAPQPAVPQPIAVQLHGEVQGTRIRLIVTNTGPVPHQFRAKLRSVTGGLYPVTETTWLSRGWWLKWDSASVSEWEPIGPKQDGVLRVAAPSGSTQGQSVDIKFNCVNASEAESHRLYSKTPWNGQIRCVIEIQADAELANPEPQTWVLTTLNGAPATFTLLEPGTLGYRI